MVFPESTMCYSEVTEKFNLKKNTNFPKRHFSKNKCCSKIRCRAVMCEIYLVKVQCVTVKLLTIFNNTNSKVCQSNYFQN